MNYTPYHYTFNNPINFIDPFGLDTLKVDPDGVPNAGSVGMVNVKPQKPGVFKRIFSGIIKVFKAADDLVTGEPEPYEETVVEDGVDMDWYKSDESYGNQDVISRDNPNYDKIFDNNKNTGESKNSEGSGTRETLDKEIVNNKTGPAQKTNNQGQASANTDSIDIIYHKSNGLNRGGQIVRQRIPINDTSKYHIMQRSRVRKNRK